MNDLAVVMCIWQRPELLGVSLRMLAAQTFRSFDLYLVNNNGGLTAFVGQTVAEGPQPAHITHHTHNHGSFAKIETAHRLALDGYPWIAMMDDDFIFGPEFLAELWRQRREDALVSWRVWRLKSGKTYWDRTQAKPGETGHYVEGTGTIVPAGALTDPGILALSPEHSPADNLWLSFYANHVKGYRMVAGDLRASLVVDGKDQYSKHIRMKVAFLQELRRRGWKV